MKNLMLFTCVLILPGCGAIMGKKYIPVYPKYPILQPEDKPTGYKLTSDDLNPYRKAAIKIAAMADDGVITDEEIVDIEILLSDARKISKESHEKLVEMVDALTKWGKKNQAEIDVYNQFAIRKNAEVDKILELR